jgi:hypothetical protein
MSYWNMIINGSLFLIRSTAMEIWFETPNKTNIRIVCLQAVYWLRSIPMKVHTTVSSRLVISCKGIVCHKYQTLTRQQDRRPRQLEQELKKPREKIIVFNWMHDKSINNDPVLIWIQDNPTINMLLFISCS